jgi:hypothetical protein
MGARRRLISTVAVLFAAGTATFGLAACSSGKRKETPPDKPLDRLAVNEVVEGKERAFGLALPRDIQVKARFDKTVHVVSPLTPEDVTNFVRARVKNGRVIPGASVTTFADVIPHGDANRSLTIDVRSIHRADGTRSEMVVRDTTPLPAEPGLTNEERWQKAGLTPTGKVADPRHLQ